MFNRSSLIIVIVAIAAALGLWFGVRQFGPPGRPMPQMQLVKLLPQPRALPPVALKTASGSAITPAALKGRWTLMFLGYTHCPDICPTTLAELAQAEKRWQSLPEHVRPQVVFVSVDPERDTPTRIGEYAHAFHPDTLAATADVPALEKFATSLGFVFMKAPGANFEHNPQDYSVDHSAHIAVLDPQGRLAGLIRPPLQPQAIAADLITLDAMGRAR